MYSSVNLNCASPVKTSVENSLKLAVKQVPKCMATSEFRTTNLGGGFPYVF